MVAASPAVNLATPNNRKKTTRLYLATAWPAGKLHFCKVETMNILLGGWPTLRPISQGEAGCYRRLWGNRLPAQESGALRRAEARSGCYAERIPRGDERVRSHLQYYSERRQRLQIRPRPSRDSPAARLLVERCCEPAWQLLRLAKLMNKHVSCGAVLGLALLSVCRAWRRSLQPALNPWAGGETCGGRY